MLKLKPTKDTKANAYFAALDKAGQMMTLAGMYAEVSAAGITGKCGACWGVGGCWELLVGSAEQVEGRRPLQFVWQGSGVP